MATLEETSTKKGVSFQYPRRVEALELEEGVYCVDFISIAMSNSFNVCGGPLIRVVADRVTNAGLWRFGVAGNLSTAQRVLAFAFCDEVGKLAVTDFPELVSKYRGLEEHRLDFIAKPQDHWTDVERKTLREFYDKLPDEDRPPQPLQGIASVLAAVKGFARPGEVLISKFHVTVNGQGDVVDTEVLESTSREATEAGIAAAKALKFVPAVCGGKPCRMEFPVYLVFR